MIHNAATAKRTAPSLRIPTVLLLASLVSLAIPTGVRALEFPGTAPGKAEARSGDGKTFTLENAILSARWEKSGNSLRFVEIEDPIGGAMLRDLESPLFLVECEPGSALRGADLKCESIRVDDVAAKPDAPRLADREAGKRIVAELQSTDGGWSFRWSATLRDASNDIQIECEVLKTPAGVSIKRLTLLDLAAADARTEGKTKGSVAVAGSFFFAYQHPAAENLGKDGRVVCSLDYVYGKSLRQTAAIGVAPAGQLRRAFLYSINRNRAFPHRTFLHYNAWLDINTPWKDMTEDEALHVIEQWKSLLVEKHGTVLDSFVIDDGWDNPNDLWQWGCGMPNGLKPVSDAARAAGMGGAGMWISPAGGYGKKGNLRHASGQKLDFIGKDKDPAQTPLLLSHPGYYALFRGVCETSIRDQGCNFFKFDNTATDRPEESDSLLRLMAELRAIKPDLYLNVTVGTWPSPFWLWHTDTTWRSGHDYGSRGDGNERQRWITYRDAETYKNVVSRAPLYPISALMTHGVIHAWMAFGRNQDPKDFADEVHAYFAMGSGMQELYITPSLLTEEHIVALAEAAKWARQNENVLIDSHWIGGDPGKGEVYGFASWSPEKAFVTLRNPSEKAAQFTWTPREAFELPAAAPKAFALKNVWTENGKGTAASVDAAAPQTISLEPFELVTLEATAK